MNNRVVAYEAEHLEDIFAGQLNHDVGENTLEFGNHAKQLEIPGLSYTYMVNGSPVLCCGIAPLWGGVCEGWVIAGEQIYSHGVGAARAIRTGLDLIAAREKMHRIQTAILTGDERLPRFAQFLGFQREGLMRNYGVDRKDYELYSRVM